MQKAAANAETSLRRKTASFRRQKAHYRCKSCRWRSNVLLGTRTCLRHCRAKNIQFMVYQPNSPQWGHDPHQKESPLRSATAFDTAAHRTFGVEKTALQPSRGHTTNTKPFPCAETSYWACAAACGLAARTPCRALRRKTAS